MTTVDEKEILEIEKLKMDLRQGTWLYILKFYIAVFATVTVTVFATKFLIGGN